MDVQIIQITLQLLKKNPWSRWCPRPSQQRCHWRFVCYSNSSQFGADYKQVLAIMKNCDDEAIKTKKREFWLMTLKRQRLTCSCGVNACGEVPRRRLNTAHLRSTPPRQCFQGSCGVSAARIVRRCTAVHLITSSLRKEVNEAVCWSERKTAGTQRKLLYWLMSRKLGSSLKDTGGKKLSVLFCPTSQLLFYF